MRRPREGGSASRLRGLPPVLPFNISAVSFGEGVRAGFAVTSVVVLYEWLRWPGLMEAALAALLSCICDAGGPLRRRLPAVLAFGVIGAAITGGFGLLREAPIAVDVLAGGLFVFAAAFVRAFGSSAMQVGNLLSVVLALTMRENGPRPEAALEAAGMFLVGNLWALLLTAVIWRLQPFRPARAAVAACLHAMAVMASEMRAMARASPADAGQVEAAWDHHARTHRRVVRERLEAAREAVLATVRFRGPASGPAAQSWLRLEAADQLFGGLIALSDLLASSRPPTGAPRAEKVLRLVIGVLRVLEREVMGETTRLRPGLERAIVAIPLVARGTEPPPPPGSPAERLVDLADFMAERLRATLSPSQGADDLPIVPPRRWRDVIGVNLTWQSAVMRHALRVATVAVPGFAVVLLWPAPYLHWFAITLLMTLQPYVAPTLVRAVERVGGTVLGGLLAAAITVVCVTPLQSAAAMFPLAVMALTVRAVSFGLFMTGLTPVVVLLSEIGTPSVSGWHIALMRALLTAAGGAAALLAGLLLWPSWEPERLRGEMRAALRAHGGYAAAVIDARFGEATPSDIAAARRRAGAASNAFEASLQRVLLERSLRSDGALETMLTVDAALRRLAGRLSALHLARDDSGDRQAWRALRDWILLVTEMLAEGRADIPPRPVAPAARAGDLPFARLARPLELAAGAVSRGEARPAG